MSDYYVSLSEFLAGVEKAYIRAYLNDDPDLADKRNWHPEDLSYNLSVIIESIGAYSHYIIRERAIEDGYSQMRMHLTEIFEDTKSTDEKTTKKSKRGRKNKKS